MLLHDFHPNRSSGLWRAAYIVSVLLVFSYIFFDVLDLDGSDFPKLFTPVEKIIIVAVVPSDAQLNRSPESDKSWEAVPLLFADGSAKYAPLQHAGVSEVFPLVEARAHGYRVGLPRDSTSDSCPYH